MYEGRGGWPPGSANTREVKQTNWSAPVAGRETQLFHFIFTHPGMVILVQPCTDKLHKCGSDKILDILVVSFMDCPLSPPPPP